ncbi:MAG: hypothetical protein ACJ76F_01920, partial [Bacteroidia bacterium]
FRLPDSAHSDPLIGLRMFSRTWKNLDGKKEISGQFRILITDSRQSVCDLRKEYIVHVKGYEKDEIACITRDISYGYAEKGKSRLFLILLSLVIVPVCFFSKRRAQWSLIVAEFVEISATVRAALIMGIKQVHFFSPAEKDANLAFLILKRAGLTVTKHPSPGALVSHHKYLQADILAFSSNYQEQEYDAMLRETIRVSATESLPPETYLTYANLYKETKAFEYEIGFYSHGGWFRVMDGKTSGLFAKPEEEEKCIDLLKQFLDQHPEKKLMIFLHPKEKSNMAETEKYYFQRFKKEQIVFYTDKLPSSHAFYKAEIGIGSYSTVLFEREYMGFKTLILREEDRDFPIKGTLLFENSFNSAPELGRKIELLSASI